MEVFRQLRQYYIPHKKLLFISIGALIVSTALGLVYPNLLRYLIDDVIMKEKYNLIPMLAIAVFLVASIKGLFTFIFAYIGHVFGVEAVFDMRNALYKKLQYLSFQYYDNAKTGDLMSRLTGDVEAFRMFLSFGFAQLLNVFIMVLFGSIAMMVINVELTLVTLLTMPFLAFAAFRFEKLVHPAFRSIREAMATLTTAVQENVTGVRTVKSFAREAHEVDKFAHSSTMYKNQHIMTASLWAKYFPLMELLANLSIVILLGYGGFLVINDTLSLGELVAFFSLIWYIIGPIWGLGFHLNNLTQSKAAGERLIEVLDNNIHVPERDNAKVLDEMDGHVRFDNVSLKYNHKAVALQNITFDAPPGKVIGLLGATGSGKTSIIQLLLRSYDATQGNITVDGNDVRNVTKESLRNKIGVVYQETFLFSASIRDNISYGNRDASMEDIVRVAKLAQAHDFILEMPKGYDTVVGERGLGLSGGQKQRIAIARALLVDPKILVLDDATSAIDMETEHDIQIALRNAMKGRTTFIIAHRLSSLKHADEIIVLEEGKIVERGNHDELVAKKGNYHRVFDIQFSDREMNNEESKYKVAGQRG